MYVFDLKPIPIFSYTSITIIHAYDSTIISTDSHNFICMHHFFCVYQFICYSLSICLSPTPSYFLSVCPSLYLCLCHLTYLFFAISARIFSPIVFLNNSIFSTIAVRPSDFRSFSRESNFGPNPASTLISPTVVK